ncbi:MAG: hypothetical protein IJE01_07955 [Clostridia bacterium]|nr:hypothetical protein [Clostridia bacterium]
MKKMKCEVCGSTSIKKVSDTTFECQECGVQYDKNEVMKLLVEVSDVASKNEEICEDRSNNSGNNFSSTPDVFIEMEENFSMTVKDSFFINGRGAIAVGEIDSGRIEVGENVKINGEVYKVSGIEMFRKQLVEAESGMTVGLLIHSYRGKISAGTIITK